jgi:NitT/TauT family transport system substrate-binding protein
MMSDLGYNPYASLLVADADYVKSHQDLVQRMVAATIEGWQKYLSSPEETNRYILSQNQQGMTAEALSYGVEKMKPLCYPLGFDPSQLGSMSEERWVTLADQLKSLGILSSKVDPRKAFDLQYSQALRLSAATR